MPRVLIDQALSADNKRATQIVKQLGSDSYKIVSMDVSTSASEIISKYRSARVMMAEAAPVAPEMASGDQTLSVRVTGTIELE